MPTAVMVAQRVATILSTYGLNARLEPGGEGEVERILEEGVDRRCGERGGWVDSD